MALLCLFALPFAGFGFFALWTALRQIFDGSGGSKVWLLLLFGFVFSGIGFGLIVGAIYGARVQKRQQRNQAEHPREPWLWRDDWAAGRVVSRTKSDTIGAWVFAALWNAVSMPMLILVPREAARKPIVYVGLLFPVVGVFLLVRAIRGSLALHRFGKTVFEMASIPGVIGGDLKGVIQTRLPEAPPAGLQLRISCVNRVTTGSGDDSTTRENILWREEAQLAPGQFCAGPVGTSIPVSFQIPWESQPTETRGPRDEIVWLLEAQASLPGVDYHDIFDVPVFRTAETPPHRQMESAAREHMAQRPEALTVAVTSAPNGVEYYFPAARNKGFAAWSTLFFLIFGGAAFFLAYFHAPLVFSIAFGFFALLLLYATVQMWAGTTRVGIGNNELLVQDGWLGGGKVRRIAFEELASIDSKISSQQGGATGTAYYDIEARLKGGRKVTLARTIQNKREADWLLAEWRRLANLQTQAVGAGK